MARTQHSTRHRYPSNTPTRAKMDPCFDSSGQPMYDAEDSYASRSSPELPRSRSSTRSDMSMPESNYNSEETLDEDKFCEALGGGLLAKIQEIRRSGVERLDDIKLPKICVVGEQSVGKSSVIERLSGIRVPRDQNTCTRCPIEINLKLSDSDWSCTVYLQLKYLYDGAAKKTGASRAKPLGPWVLQEHEQTIELKTTTSKDEIVEMIRCAQRAALNPKDSPKEVFVSSDKPRYDQVPFSPNVVRVDISGRKLTNLSLYDLPGIVAQYEDKEMPQLIHNLIREYIKPETSIVLLTLMMNNDAHNSMGAAMIEKMDAQNRTLGVLTKPDRVGDTGVDQWRNRLSGQAFPLKLGYYVVKNPSQPKNTNHDQATFDEQEFFRNSPAFRDDLYEYSSRFGIDNLRTHLSQTLEEAIKTYLPTITKRTETTLQQLRNELSHCPKPPEGNVSLEIHDTIRTFTNELRKTLDGGSANNKFFSTWHAQARDFHYVMVESGPGLLLPTKPTRTKPINVPPLASAPARQSIDLVNTIEITSDAEEDHATGRKRTAPRMEQNPKRQRFGNDSQTIFDRIVPYAPRVENFTKQEVIRKKAKRFTLAEIRQKIDQVNKGLPGGRDHRIVEHMMRESSEHWPEVLENFHNVTAELFREAINRCMNTAFPRWSKVPLGKKLKKISEGFVEQALEELWEQSSQSLDIEMNRLITMNEKWMNDRSYESLKELKTHFRDNRRETFAIETANRNIVVDAATQKAGAERQVEKECILAAQELSEMATTRAYYSLASQRLADTIVQRTCYHLFTGTRDNMGDHIMEELGMNLDNANESLRESLMVSPVAMKERQRLEEEIETLEKARLQLKALTSS